MLETDWVRGPLGVMDPKRNAPTPGTPWKWGILVVDDTKEVRDTLRAGLWHFEFNVWVAASGPEAVARYQVNSDSIDMVLLDVRMPDWDGPQTLAALRKVDEMVRCCFMSGDTGEYSEADLLGLGARRVFAKPFRIAEMAESIRALILSDQPIRTEEGRWEDDGGQGVSIREPVPRKSIANGTLHT